MIDPLSIHIPLSDPGTAVPPSPPRPVRKLLSPSPTHRDDYIMEIDYSMFAEFLVCPRRFENKAIHSREAAKEQTATLKGGLFHSVEEMRLRSGSSTPSLELRQAQLEKVAEHYVQHPPAHDDFRQQTFFIDVLNQYNKTYANDSMPEKVLLVDGEPFVERPFKVEFLTINIDDNIPYPPDHLVLKQPNIISEPDTRRFLPIRDLHIVLTGKIDTVLEQNSTLFVKDTKTTSRGGDEFFRYFILSFQTRGYCWVVQKLLSRPVAGCILDAICWRKETKTGKGTTFHRPVYFYSVDQLQDWEDSMKAHFETLAHMLVKGFFPQVSLSFRSPCVWCDYEDNCRLPRAQRAADLASNIYRDVTWNPMHQE